jgi:hypothetical protein
MSFTEADRAFYKSLNLPEPTLTPPDLFSAKGLQEGDRVSTFFIVDSEGTRELGTPPNEVMVSELPLPELLKG